MSVKKIIDLQEGLMLHKNRAQGGGITDCTKEENLELMTKVMSEKELHLNVARAYKHAGTTNALDGTDGGMIANDAKVFWDELYMRPIIDEDVQEVERMWYAGELKWNFSTVMSFIEPYPKRCLLYTSPSPRDVEESRMPSSA